ncbi:mechanosensitive ion channel domain-containing protein [Chishuiella sp.]|uniref:mechanosensitive ion channel family protein n=1 Tax=Chishuiella sp. TaxID=1969467 RepID=UPI0028AAC6E9|nr:mechanosensitive ion channel domain-containing protein [Chishuiella sp.]
MNVKDVILNEEIIRFDELLISSWNYFLKILPSIALSIIVGLIGILIIRYSSKIAFKIIDKKSSDPLVSDFLVKIISLVLFILLIIICLTILGWGQITADILTGAGIGTFVLGFALKDIGENFLSGISMAFSRPFEIGDIIEINDIKGQVVSMSLRETIIKGLDGRNVFIPNGTMVTEALQNYTVDHVIRDEFEIGLDYNDDIQNIILLIEGILKGFDQVLTDPEPLIFIEELSASTVNLKIEYWISIKNNIDTDKKLRSNIMLKTFQTILEKGYKLPNNILEVKITENQKAKS